MNNLRSFSVKYLGPTDTRGSRIRIVDNRFNKKIILNFNSSYRSTYEQAEAYLLGCGIICDYQSEAGDEQLLLTTNFNSQIGGN